MLGKQVSEKAPGLSKRMDHPTTITLSRVHYFLL
jgi:hypothetical protein